MEFHKEFLGVKVFSLGNSGGTKQISGISRDDALFCLKPLELTKNSVRGSVVFRHLLVINRNLHVLIKKSP